jgi:hypothetical protein
MSDPSRQEPSTLHYEPPRESEFRRGATPVARVAAGVFSLLFIALAVGAWHDDSRGKFTLGSLLYVPVLLCFAGSALCMLVALGRLGRHKDGWI